MENRMDEGLGAKELKTGMNIFTFLKKSYAEFNSRGSTKRAQEFLDIHNNKREKFSRKTCEVPLKSIHCQIEESINHLEKLKKLSSIEKDNKQATELIIQECFKAFSPQETYLTTYKKKRVSNINSLFFSDTKYREEFNVEIRHASTSLTLDIDSLLKSNNGFLAEKELLNIFEDIVNKLFYGNIDIITPPIN